MCGIAGIYNFSQKVDEATVGAMITSITHRGPDGGATWLSPDGALCLGHRRLSIIDLSLDAFQPMHYFDNRYTIVFNGEIYNYIELKENLLTKGYTFKTSSDTEVLMALYHDKKEKCLDELDGMFAFAIWDEYEHSLFCARDRFGEKPFYYTILNNAFYFASEMKALWAAGVPKTTNVESIFYYLNYNSVRNPNKPESTFYENIKMLENAHYILVNGKGEIKKIKYWDLPIETDDSLSYSDAVTRFKELFQRSISRRLRSDVAVGTSLSGGLDSSSVVRVIDTLRVDGQALKTFSARFKNFDKDEGKYIEAVLKNSKFEPCYTWPSEESFTENFELLCYHQEEPFGSASIYNQWEVMKLAKFQNVKVLLDGQGADEVAAGYLPYIQKYYSQLFRLDRRTYSEELEAYKLHYGNMFKLSTLDKFSALYPKLYDSVKNLSITKFIFKNPILSKSFYFAHNHLDSPYKIYNDLNADLKFSTMTYGLQELLRYADRNSMAHGVEVRLPFLDHELVQFLFSLPPDYKIKHGVTKSVIRSAMRGIVPDFILDRKDKIGYDAPQEKWLKSKQINDLFQESFLKLKNEKIIDNSFKNSDLDNMWKILIMGKYLS